MEARHPAVEPKAPPVELSFLLSQVGAHAAVIFGEKLAALSLKPHDAGILRILGSNPGLTQQSLSELLGIFPSQLVGLLDGLEKLKLVDRRNSPADRRSYELHLTPAGRRTLATIHRLTRQLDAEVFAALNHEERRGLADTLTRIVAEQRIVPGVHPAYRQTGGR